MDRENSHGTNDLPYTIYQDRSCFGKNQKVLDICTDLLSN